MIFERGYFRTSKDINLNEKLYETRAFSKKTLESKPTVFISHKHCDLEDREEVKGIIEIFENLGAKTYIDSMDHNMPDETSGETALRIREIIEHFKKFVFVATEKAIGSYWCNWELGIGDTHKFIDHIAIIPIKEKGQSDSQYIGSEYLQIYPTIKPLKSYGYFRLEGIDNDFCVFTPKIKDGLKSITPLNLWLKQ